MEEEALEAAKEAAKAVEVLAAVQVVGERGGVALVVVELEVELEGVEVPVGGVGSGVHLQGLPVGSQVVVALEAEGLAEVQVEAEEKVAVVWAVATAVGTAVALVVAVKGLGLLEEVKGVVATVVS